MPCLSHCKTIIIGGLTCWQRNTKVSGHLYDQEGATVDEKAALNALPGEGMHAWNLVQG